MHATILSIGDELTLGQNLDTNARWLSRRLAEMAVVVVEHRTVADDRSAIAGAMRDLAARSALLVCTGGLGPTADDLTRDALGDVVAPGRPLIEDAHARRALEKRYAGRPMPRSNLVQAQRPEGTTCLGNPQGTAPGLAGRVGVCRVFALPGPPREMEPMFERHVGPLLAAEADGEALCTASVQAYGLGESDAAERLGPLTDRGRDLLVGTTVSGAVCSARIRLRGEPAAAAAAIEAVAADVESRWFPYAYGRDGAELGATVGEALRAGGHTLVTAESCTGGHLAAALVDVPGASASFLGGWIPYADARKTACLDVPPALLQRVGAVSAEVAAALALGALRAGGSEMALSTTGIAGPDGGTPGKPVGTVFVGLARRADGEPSVTVRSFRFGGARDAVCNRAVKSALQMLRFELLGLENPPPLLWETTAPIRPERAP